MFKRRLKSIITEALTRSPIVLVTGARQTGKTTLVKEIGKNTYHYVTFDDIRSLSAAQSDPIGFISGLPKPVILDEVQRVPDIFLTIKKDIDENRIPGRYLLTGSANPLMIPNLANAFVGRMEIFTLYPLSQGELLDKKEHFIEKLFEKDAHLLIRSPLIKKELLEKIIIGGYPLAQNISETARESWINSYITTILQRDVQELAQISGLAEFPNLLRLLATRTSNLLNVAELSRSSNIAISTLHRYLTLLDALFIISFIQPWHANLGKRLVKAPKTSFIDTGILTFLLGINSQRLLSDSMLLGGILENFVVSELRKQITWNQERIQLYHFRTQAGIEVDVILENAAGKLVGIEIKSSETVTASDFKGLKYLQEERRDLFIKGIVLYSGNEFVPFGQNLFALPLSSLWML